MPLFLQVYEARQHAVEQRGGAISLSRRTVELLLARVRVLNCKRGKKVCFQYSEVNSGGPKSDGKQGYCAL